MDNEKRNNPILTLVCLVQLLFCITVTTVTVIWILNYKNQITDLSHKNSSTFNSECFKYQRHREKFPSLYYSVIHNTSFQRSNRLMFQLKLPLKLDFESKIVAASDTLEHIISLSRFHTYPYNVTIVYGRATSRIITIYSCFNGAVILNEIIQMNIKPMLHGGFVTMIVTEINKND